MTPSGMRGVLNDAASIYFLDATLASGGRSRLQNQRRIDFVQILMLHGRSSVEASSRCNALRPEPLAAPRADDQIGLPRNRLLNCDHAVFRCALISTIGEDVDAACDLDELRDPIQFRRSTGSSHSSKNTLGCFGNRAARFRTSAKRVSIVPTSC
jgi:hypothetical protein